MRWTQAQRWRSAAAAAVVGVALVTLGAAPARGAGAADEQPVVRAASIEPASGVTVGEAVAPTPTRVYVATLSPRGLPMLAALREAAAASRAGGDAQKNRTRERAPQPPAGGVWHEEVTLEPIWSAEDTSAAPGAMVPVAIAVGRCAVVMVSRSAGGAGPAIVTSFAKADGSLNWSRPTTGVAATGGTTLSAFEPVGAAVVPLKGTVPAGDCGEGMIAQGVLVGGTGTIGTERTFAVVGFNLDRSIDFETTGEMVAQSPLVRPLTVGDVATVARGLVSVQEGTSEPLPMANALGIAGTRPSGPDGRTDWAVDVAIADEGIPRSPIRWVANPTGDRWTISFDHYDVPTDLCETRPLYGDTSPGGTPQSQQSSIPRVSVVGTSRATPTGPRTIRLANWDRGGSNNSPTWAGWYFRSLSTPYDNTAVSISYADQVDDRPFISSPTERRGIFVVGSSGLASAGGAYGPGAETIVLSWSGRLVDMQGELDVKWPRWAAAPPFELQGAGRVQDGGVMVTSPAPGLPGSAPTELYSISRWVDAAGSVRWRVMRWRPDRIWPPPPQP